jgi:hypothetical protein
LYQAAACNRAGKKANGQDWWWFNGAPRIGAWQRRSERDVSATKQQKRGKRIDINKIAVPMVRAQRKGGAILMAMAEAGERHTGRNPHNLPNLRASHSDTPDAKLKPTLAMLGFSWARASRWQFVAKLPDEAACRSGRQRRCWGSPSRRCATTCAKVAQQVRKIRAPTPPPPKPAAPLLLLARRIKGPLRPFDLDVRRSKVFCKPSGGLDGARFEKGFQKTLFSLDVRRSNTGKKCSIRRPARWRCCRVGRIGANRTLGAKTAMRQSDAGVDRRRRINGQEPGSIDVDVGDLVVRLHNRKHRASDDHDLGLVGDLVVAIAVLQSIDHDRERAEHREAFQRRLAERTPGRLRGIKEWRATRVNGKPASLRRRKRRKRRR